MSEDIKLGRQLLITLQEAQQLLSREAMTRSQLLITLLIQDGLAWLLQQ